MQRQEVFVIKNKDKKYAATIRQLTAKIVELENRIASLEKDNKNLKRKIK